MSKFNLWEIRRLIQWSPPGVILVEKLREFRGPLSRKIWKLWAKPEREGATTIPGMGVHSSEWKREESFFKGWWYSL